MTEKTYSFSDLSRSAFRRALKQADPSIFDDSLLFLEADPRTFGSGYLKQMIWKYIKRYEISSQHLARLENAALLYLSRPMTPEFRPMCQTMCLIASPDFWLRVEAQLGSDDERVRLNASCLLPYSEGMAKGEKIRLQWKHRKLNSRKTQETFYSVSELLNLMKASENWRNGEAVYKEPNHADIPILPYDPSHDLEIASLDMAASNTKIVLEKLGKILSTGTLSSLTLKTWIYTLYLLLQLHDKQAVSIIIRFVKDKIVHKFESPKKELLLMASLKVLRYYDTPEALRAIREYQEFDQLFSTHYSENANGWLSSYLTMKD